MQWNVAVSTAFLGRPGCRGGTSERFGFPQQDNLRAFPSFHFPFDERTAE